jgi:hypothetical protein
MEVISIVMFYLLQMMRLDLGARANRNEKKESMQFFSFFTLISIVFYLYFATQTTYVLIVEYIFGLIGLFFPVVELLLSLYAILLFSKIKTVN